MGALTQRIKGMLGIKVDDSQELLSMDRGTRHPGTNVNSLDKGNHYGPRREVSPTIVVDTSLKG